MGKTHIHTYIHTHTAVMLSMYSRSALGLRFARLMSTKTNFAPTASVTAFIDQNLAAIQHDGDASFLSGPTPRTRKLWTRCHELLLQEHANNGVLSINENIVSDINAFPAGYITGDAKDEVIVGLQTDKPLDRAIKPLGGWRMVQTALKAYGKELPESIRNIFQNYRKTHNDCVFDLYTEEMQNARKQGILTGLPDAYGRGRIIGDSRRVALWGVDKLIADKEADKVKLAPTMDEETMRLREEVSEQIRALKELKGLGSTYGFDLSRPATNAKEAIQWLYMGYLAACKQQDGAAMSLGRVDAFLDAYIQRDLDAGLITEEEAQEMIDDFVIKLRLIRHLRPPAYDVLFAGGPTWVTANLGGMRDDDTHLVTKTAFRFLQTLNNLGPAPEPNLTVMWDERLPKGFKDFSAEVSINTSSIQYEGDEKMRLKFGSDTAIACCVSGMTMGKSMQFFGARANGVKCLLYALNGGKDEVTGFQMAPELFPPAPEGQALDIDDVMQRYEGYMSWLAGLYSSTMNCIHYSHDRYDYESLQMALHDTHVTRSMAYGVAGLSVVADSLSAIKYAKVTPVRDERGLITDFKTEGEFPKYGNDDERADALAQWTVDTFMGHLRKNKTYRDSHPTLSVLTITSNVVYGNTTGSTPCGRKRGEPFAPGANPGHGRDTSGAIASLNSVAKISYDNCEDGISNTFSIVPASLGKSLQAQKGNLTGLLDSYFSHQGGQHLNVNVLDRDMLIDAMDNPQKYPTLTIRVSGYAVNFTKLTRAQQEDVIGRTFHSSLSATKK